MALTFSTRKAAMTSLQDSNRHIASERERESLVLACLILSPAVDRERESETKDRDEGTRLGTSEKRRRDEDWEQRNNPKETKAYNVLVVIRDTKPNHFVRIQIIPYFRIKIV